MASMVSEPSSGTVRFVGAVKVMLEAAPMVTVIVPDSVSPPAEV